MTTRLKSMSGEIFVEKILNGERDFSRIELGEGFDFTYYSELQEYLKNQNFKDEPLNINFSNFRYIQANCLCLPYLKGKRANFEGADLKKTNLWKANLKEANFGKANLMKANLMKANLKEANFWKAYLIETEFERANLEGANLREANLWKAYLAEADFKRADLRGVEQLEVAIDLEFAKFFETKVTEAERKIIEERLKEIRRFIVE